MECQASVWPASIWVVLVVDMGEIDRACQVVWCAYLFWVEVYGFAGHVLCQTEDMHLLADGGLNDVLEGVFGVAWAELARMAVMGEWHVVCIPS